MFWYPCEKYKSCKTANYIFVYANCQASKKLLNNLFYVTADENKVH